MQSDGGRGRGRGRGGGGGRGGGRSGGERGSGRGWNDGGGPKGSGRGWNDGVRGGGRDGGVGRGRDAQYSPSQQQPSHFLPPPPQQQPHFVSRPVSGFVAPVVSSGEGSARGGGGGPRGSGRGWNDGGRGGGRDGGVGRGRGAQYSPSQQQSQLVSRPVSGYVSPVASSGEGSARGGGGGGGGGYAGALQRSSEYPITPTLGKGSIVPKMQALKIGEGSTSSSTTGSLVPIRRPDEGGAERISTVNILANHFRVTFNPETLIRHYDIDVKPKGGGPAKFSKATLCFLKDKLFADNTTFPLEKTAYDGEKILFSAEDLPTGEFTVKLSDEEGTRERSFVITVTLVKELELQRLMDYLSGQLLQLPRDILQGMDLVMKENPRRRMLSIGRTFHPFDPIYKLQGGIVASKGFQHSLKPTSQGLSLCLDYSVLAVRKRIPVLDFLREYVDRFDLRRFSTFRNQIERALKGLKVTVTHRRTKQKYVVSGLSDRPARDISFSVEDPTGQIPPESVRLLTYFQKKYPEASIRHPDIPCLNVGKGGKVNYIPIEFCVLAEGQRYPKEHLMFEANRDLKNSSLAQPNVRRSTICEMLQNEDGPCGGEVSRNFGFNVMRDMTRVQGRVINPPRLSLRAALTGKPVVVTVNPENCQWNLVKNSVFEGKSVSRWALLDFSERLNCNYFIPELITRCNKLGVRMSEPLFVEFTDMTQLASVDSLLPLLGWAKNRAGELTREGELQILLCAMAGKDPGYERLKWISETKLGIVTQCFLSGNANNRGAKLDQFLANIGQKINAKLGGINVNLNDPHPLFKQGSHLMVIGADVNHPRAMDDQSPSVAAVVGSTNKGVPTKYISRVSFQEHRSEKIKGFGGFCVELIESYEKINGVKPQKLLIFRDGVSEGQFDMVLNEELLDLMKAMKEGGFWCSITLIVAQKRHQTRLFPEAEPVGRSLNVPPGTVVDTKIVHPFDFDFYLASHYGGIGTSKPTHYHVLYDDHQFSSDALQNLIYSLCFTSARCSKPISLAPPVFYADLVAFRGRMYYNSWVESHPSSGASPSFTASQHRDIENHMFFV